MDPVRDISINKETKIIDLLKQFKNVGGFQAQELYRAFEILDEMFKDSVTKILSFPADIIATGTRGLIKDMIKNKLFDIVITTTGTLDHDLARLKKDYYIGFFEADDRELRNHNIYRLGNVFIPEDNYGPVVENILQPILKDIYEELDRESYYEIECPICKKHFKHKEKEELIKIFDEHLEKNHNKNIQKVDFKIKETNKKIIGTYELIWKIGERLEDYDKKEDSIIFWSYKNKIPIFVPGITDGAVGTQILFFKIEHPDFDVSVWKDEEFLMNTFWSNKKFGALMLGGGISKHHTIWWSQFANGLEYAVYITSAVELDGSLSGARTREAISWGKIKKEAKHVTVWGDITIVLPILVAPFL